MILLMLFFFFVPVSYCLALIICRQRNWLYQSPLHMQAETIKQTLFEERIRLSISYTRLHQSVKWQYDPI